MQGTHKTPEERRAALMMDIQLAALELCGTFVFLLLAFGGVQAAARARLTEPPFGAGSAVIKSVPSIDQLLYISVSFGLALLIAVWMFYRVTGGAFNPAVSTALLLIGVIGPIRWMLCCIAQLVGAITAAAVLLALVPGPLACNTFPGPGVSKAQAVFIEMFLTSFLVLAVIMMAAEKHRTTPFAPIGIGLTLFAGQLFGTAFTGASMNTARSFGPAVVSGFPYRGHWVYWLGPFLGSLLATAFYSGLKHINYWKLNPDQDAPTAASPSGPIDTIRAATSRSSAGGGTSRPGTATTVEEGEGGHIEKHRQPEVNTPAPPGHAHV